MYIKKHLSFTSLRKTISQRFLQIEDYRQQGKIDYTLHDCFMSAFAMMYFQDPALLEFQRRMQEGNNLNNLKTTFNINSIPKDSQLRDVLDNCPNDKLSDIFSDLLRPLQRGKQLEQFQFIDDYYLVALDGSGYFSSDKLCCPSCLTKTKKGTVRYEHQILQAVIACPGIRQVLPLAPEPIQNTDGTIKQDCEINAGKRILSKIRKDHPKLKIILTCDDLYSKQPFVDSAKQANMSFILVAKPSDHKFLHEWVTELKQLNGTSTLKLQDQKGRIHRYEWVNEVPLNGTKDADHVNYFEYALTNKKGKVTYKNSWVTDLKVEESNVIQLVKGGRARWKIENETFNTLKNQGYHLEHNYGHGQNNLSFTFFLLNLLAFFSHQIFEFCDPLYQKCRLKFSSRNQLRCTFRLLIFQSWEHMVKFIISPPNEPMPP